MNTFLAETWHTDPLRAAGEKWTTVAKLCSPDIVPHAGRLRFDNDGRCTIVNHETGQSTTLTQQELLSLVASERVINSNVMSPWRIFVNTWHRTQPHLVVTVHPMRSPSDKERSFAVEEAENTSALLASLEMFYSGRETSDLDCFADAAAQVYGDEECDRKALDANFEPMPAKSADGQSEQPMPANETLVCIYLDDSAILNMICHRVAGLHASEKMWQSTGRSLGLFLRHMSFRVAPSNISCVPRIPTLQEKHGLHLSLFDYQERFLNWLMHLENASKQGRMVQLQKRNHCPSYAQAPLHFFRENWTILSTPRQRNRFCEPFRCNGGIIASKTGTGKTTIAIALVHIAKCLEATALRCAANVGDFSSTPAQRRRLQVFVDQSVDWRYYAECTLVVCPRQMVRQWIDELIKTVGATQHPLARKYRELRVFGVDTVRDLRSLSLAALQGDIDVLVVSKEIFKSSAVRSVSVAQHAVWKESVTAKFQSASPTIKISYDATTFEALRFLVEQNKSASLSRPNDQTCAPGTIFAQHVPLHAVRFRRLFIDEIHELDRAWSLTERAVASLASETTHGITATLNADGDEAFGWTKKTASAGLPALLDIDANGRAALGNVDTVLRYYFVKSFAMTADCDERMPPLHFYTVSLNLTAVERAVYTSISVQNTLQRLMFCSHHMLQDEQWQSLLQTSAGSAEDVPHTAERAAAFLQRHRTVKLQKLAETRQEALELEKNLLERCLLPLSECELLPRLREIYGNEQHEQHQVIGEMQKICLNSRTTVSRLPATDGDDESAAGDDDERDRVALSEKIAKQRRLQDDIESGTVTIDADAQDRFLAVYYADQDARASAKNASARADAAFCAQQREIYFFDAVVERLQESGRVRCAICVDEDSDEDSESESQTSAQNTSVCFLTVCGHEFCRSCATQWFARSRRCPLCRRTLQLAHDVRQVSLESSADNVVDEGAAQVDKDSPSARYGSKIGALLALLAELQRRDDFRKVVVYAQFERLLKLVASALRDCGQSVLTLDGSAEACQRSLQRFRTDPTERIMLLSSERSISGVHLVEANHLVALHPLLGSPDQVYAKNWQAIGRIRRLMQRSECHVWTLVTRNTIEQRLYAEQKQEARNRTRNDARIYWH